MTKAGATTSQTANIHPEGPHSKKFCNCSSHRQHLGARFASAMTAEGVMQIVQHALALQATRLHDCQDPFHESATAFTDTAEAAPAPQDRTPQQPLNDVVRLLH